MALVKLDISTLRMAARDEVDSDRPFREGFDIARLNGRHRRLMRELCVGHTIKDAATIVGLSADHAAKIARTPLFQKELAKMQSEIDQQFVDTLAENPVHLARYKLERASSAAADALISGLSDERQEEKRRSAVEILNRVGLKESPAERPTARVEIDIGIKNMLKDIAEAGGKVEGDEDFESPEIEDAEYELQE